MNRPSKKIIYLGIGAILLIVGILFYKHQSSASISKGSELSFEAASSTDSTIDTDSDGLPDWQEINIWHSDPNNPDSDNDGTTDGDEVGAGRDPAKPAPNDEISADDPRSNAAVKAVIASDNSANSNLTQNLSKNFVSNFLSVSNNNNLNEEDQANVIQQTLSKVPAPASVKKYTLSSLSVFDPKNSDDIKKYANSFALIQKNDFSAYMDIQDPSFDQTAGVYQNLSRDLASISVPKEMASTHLDIVNNYNEMYVSLLSIDQYDSDPVKALLSMKTFKADEDAQPDLYNKLGTYFKNNGIIFDKNNDEGYIFTIQ